MAEKELTTQQLEFVEDALNEVASGARIIKALCSNAIDHENSGEFIEAARAYACKLGYIADLVLGKLNLAQCMGGADEWLLTRRLNELVEQV